MIKRNSKYEIIKHCVRSLPYQISITPTSLQSYDRGIRCLLYIKILDAKVFKTVKASDEVYLDYDRKNRLIGVEII